MSSSMQGAEVQIEFVYDVTERVKDILVTTNGGKEENPLIAYNSAFTKEENDKRILSDSRRGMTRIVDGKVFDGNRLPFKLSDEAESDAGFQMLKIHFSNFEKMFGPKIVDGKDVSNDDREIICKTEHLSQYEAQSFLSIATNEIFYRILGDDYGLYKPNFSNGKVCHFWKETIADQDNLCMLMVDDGFSIICNGDNEDVYYLPGAMMIEITVPISVIEEKKPITEQHITRALVSSTELFNLLQVNPEIISLRNCEDEMLKVEVKKSLELVLAENGSKQPLPNLGDQIRKPDFPSRAVNILSPQQLEDLKDALKSNLVQNEKLSPNLKDEIKELHSEIVCSEYDLEELEIKELHSEIPCSEYELKELEIEEHHSETECSEYELEELEIEEHHSETESSPAISPLQPAEENEAKSGHIKSYSKLPFFNSESKFVTSSSDCDLEDNPFTLTGNETKALVYRGLSLHKSD